MRLFVTALACLISVSVFGQGACNNQTSVTYQGYAYDIVEIGDQCWFAENCRYLPSVSTSSEYSETDPYYYVYDFEGTDVEAAKANENYENYGVLYNWPAVMNEDVCPSGWHVSSDEDWQTMEIYLGMSESEALSESSWRGTNQGFQMKSMSGWSNLMSDGTTGNGSNASGLNVFPSGYWVSTTGFENLYNLAYFWTPSMLDVESYIRSVNKNFDTVMRYLHPTNYGFSVRCIKDEPLHYDGNGDGCVNIQDMLDILLEYGQCEPETQLDFDGNDDGCVNGEDVLNILMEFGNCE